MILLARRRVAHGLPSGLLSGVITLAVLLVSCGVLGLITIFVGWAFAPSRQQLSASVGRGVGHALRAASLDAEPGREAEAGGWARDRGRFIVGANRLLTDDPVARQGQREALLGVVEVTDRRAVKCRAAGARVRAELRIGVGSAGRGEAAGEADDVRLLAPVIEVEQHRGPGRPRPDPRDRRPSAELCRPRRRSRRRAGNGVKHAIAHRRGDRPPAGASQLLDQRPPGAVWVGVEPLPNRDAHLRGRTRHRVQRQMRNAAAPSGRGRHDHPPPTAAAPRVGNHQSPSRRSPQDTVPTAQIATPGRQPTRRQDTCFVAEAVTDAPLLLRVRGGL
jgi:hypothetical protein